MTITQTEIIRSTLHEIHLSAFRSLSLSNYLYMGENKEHPVKFQRWIIMTNHWVYQELLTPKKVWRREEKTYTLSLNCESSFVPISLISEDMMSLKSRTNDIFSLLVMDSYLVV